MTVSKQNTRSVIIIFIIIIAVAFIEQAYIEMF